MEGPVSRRSATWKTITRTFKELEKSDGVNQTCEVIFT
jgi:hypothetical protein